MTPMNSPRRGRRTGAVAISAALLYGGGCPMGGGTRPAPADAPDAILVAPIAFVERNAERADVYNASGIVPLGDSSFLLVDNNTNRALIALALGADGRQAAPLALRPLTGLPED